MKKFLLFFIILFFIYFNVEYNINRESFKSKKKYLYVKNYNQEYGLTHQKNNFITLLKFAYLNNYILLSPTFILESFHNNNKKVKTNFVEYFDLENIKTNKNKIKVIGNYKKIEDILKKEKDNVEVIKGEEIPMFFKDYKHFKNLKNLKISINYKNNLLKIANDIIKNLGKYTCIHVRRSDRMGYDYNHNIATSSDNIISKLNEINSVKNLYVMTDEVEKYHFSKLKKYYNLYLFSDFEILKNIKKKDNYKLFCIENIIMDNAFKKISTFKVKSNKYDNHLYKKSGWQ